MRTLGATKGGEAGEGGENKACGPPFAASTGFRRPVPRLLRCSKEHNWYLSRGTAQCGDNAAAFGWAVSTGFNLL